MWIDSDYVLFWTAQESKSWDDEIVKFVVYRFAKGEKIDVNDPSKILTITNEPFYKLPYKNGKEKWTYVVTALDRLQNESKIAKKNVKL